MQYIFIPPKINKWYDALPKLYKGAQWFCISRQLCNYILEFVDKNEWYKDAFRKAFCSDESFFQTIVMNSGSKSVLYKYNTDLDDNAMALRYIDWYSGPQYPKILTEDDLVNIINEDCILAENLMEI